MLFKMPLITVLTQINHYTVLETLKGELEK